MGAAGKRMRLGTKSCAECRRRKVRCIFLPGQDRCDACRAHDSSCVPQEKQPPGGGDGSPLLSSGGVDDVEVLKKRLDELETLMRGLPGDMLSRRACSVGGVEGGVGGGGLTDASTAASASSDGQSPPSISGAFQQHIYPSLVDTTRISPAFQNSPLIQLFNESSIFDPITYTDTTTAPPPGPLTPSASSRLRQCLAQFAPYLPRPERVVKLFEGTQQCWLIWPPYFYGPGDADRLRPGQVPLAERTFHGALVSGRPGQTAKAVLFLALCIQQTPKRLIQSLVPPSVRQRDLVDTYVETAQALLQLDAEPAGGTLEGVEGMNMLYKLCINAGRPQRAWSWNRQAITAAICCGLPARRPARAGERAAQAWALAWRAERYMAMTLGLPSATSALHPGLELLQDESTVMTILHYFAIVCGRIIDRDQSLRNGSSSSGGGGGRSSHYATTIELSEDIEDARRRLFPAHWWAEGHLAPDLDPATGWYQQSTKVIFLTALKLVHLPYMLRAAADARYAPSRDAAMGAARGICDAYRDFRRWPGGGAELCQVMDFRACSAALVLVLGHWIAPPAPAPPPPPTSRSPHGLEAAADAEDDATLVRDVTLCLRQTAALMDCRVAEQAVRTLDALDAARRGAYMADDDYDVVVPYFGRIRIRKAFFQREEQEQEQEQEQEHEQKQEQEPQPQSQPLLQPLPKPDDAVSDYFNTVEFSTNDFLVDFQLHDGAGGDAAAAAELCSDWTELGMGYASTDWTQSFTCGPFFDVDGAVGT
ncbi:hypothetical protein V2A60_005260 [Cordyceps javanica]|uniref:Fungal specific transcription factor n=1 Tax=Cordyceps javanica TaxID=43265 RepID=A0A545VDN0_9HYPO|nr:Fungal specific transcription factor [Cordyceps javanica]TQW10506.1 Fungal specific transcription factor [Cordyceps javanica]